MPTRFAALGRRSTLLLLAALLAVSAFALYDSRGERTFHTPVVPENDRRSGADLQVYRRIIAEVHDGENYYEVANRELRAYFPVGSVFNWRPPTYAYVLGLLPGPAWIHAVLVAIGLAGLVLSGVAECHDAGLLTAGCTVLLQFGVFAWCLDGDAYFAQEVWAAMLVLVSVTAAALGWRPLAVIAGLAALFFRELVLPYCLVSAGVAWWHGRRCEALSWLAGVVLFGLFLAWHAGQVQRYLSADDIAGSGGVGEWLVYGGLTFDLRATRMNKFLFDAPGWLVLLYLLLALVGLIGWRSEQGVMLTLTTLAYLTAFSVVGMPKNINWGLMFAPLLPFGVVRAPAAVWELARTLRGTESATGTPDRDSEPVNNPVSG